MIAEHILQPQVPQVRADPPCRAGRDDRLGQVGGQRSNKGNRPDDLFDAFQQDALILGQARLVPIGGQRAADEILHTVEEVLAGQPHEAGHRFVRRDRMAVRGQEIGDMLVAEELALDQHAIEIEQQRVEIDHAPASGGVRAPNSADPMRTWVAPIITAVSKSSDIPMLRPVSPSSRASFAKSAK